MNAPFIIKEAKRIQSLIQKIELFRSPLSLELKIIPSMPGAIRLNTNAVERGNIVPEYLGFVYYLNDDTYSRIVIEREEDTNDLIASIPSVYSNLGRGTGTFLFYLSILLASKTGIKYITIDNDTEYPIRAAKGIYRWFEPNHRNLNENNQERFQRATTLEEKMNVTHEKMIFNLQRFTLNTWKDHVKEMYETQLLKNPNKKNSPWADGDFHGKIDQFIHRVQQSNIVHSTQYGPRRSARVARKTPYSRGGRGGRGKRRRTHNRRKSSITRQ